MTQETPVQSPEELPAARSVPLAQAELVFAARVQNIVDEKNEQGDYVHSNRDVRDFMIACIFELGLPLTRELDLLLHRFLDEELEVVTDNPTGKDVVDGVRRYFAERPLNAQLARAFQQLGAEALQTAGEGFHQDGARKDALAAATGTRRSVGAAPRAPIRHTPGVVARRGIAR